MLTDIERVARSALREFGDAMFGIVDGRDKISAALENRRIEALRSVIVR